MRRALALCSFVGLSACVSPLVNLKSEHPLALSGAQIVIKSDGHSEKDVARLERALQKAPEATARWGVIPGPVTVYVVRSHAELEASVKRFGFDWLRAWAHFDDVIFQAPTTWTSVQDVVDELVIHEVTHCLLFQLSADAQTWESRNIPLWFREGMAIATAKQQGRYPSLEDSAQWLEANPKLDPFGDGEALSRDRSTEVYGIALHAFEFLETHEGAEKLRALMKAMHDGADFDTAFAATLSSDVPTFLTQFRAFMKGREFRALKRSVPRLPEQVDPRPQ